MTTATPIIVLRQVEGARWCVIRRQIRNGRPVFAGRIVTARPYEAACRAAIQAARIERLALGIETNRAGLRRFDPRHDMQEPRT